MSASTSHVSFFSSAAASFQPTPYTPSSQSSSTRPPTRTHRSHDSLAVPPLGMDPMPTDPNVVFLHPPFTTFPGSSKHPDGLTYALMAENTEWFLDANDFISQPGADATGVPYPPHLEPPRGWCPARKKDLKDRGVESWPEGEEPRLRCTFCRRTYAGVNAKSMWRRHVFEKHKIAMSNRRDGNLDRPRGRGSGKENRQQQAASQKSREDSQALDSIISIVVTPQTAPEMISHKSRFRTVKPLSEASRSRHDRRNNKDTDDQSQPSTSQNKLQDFADTSEEDCEAGPSVPKAKTPPLTPHGEGSSDPPSFLEDNNDHNEDLAEDLSSFPFSQIPESPYNPLQTPSFRHSPPRLPSDQPWRFPSPSHPLHSTTRDLSLTMLSRPIPSPIIKGSMALGSSSIAMLTMNSSPFSSPAPLPFDGNFLETPARPTTFSKTINRLSFLTSAASSPLNFGKHGAGSKQPFQGSPFKSHRRHVSDISENWFSTSTSSPSKSNDPFSLYDTWPPVGGESHVSPVRLPKTPIEPESPVLRSSAPVPSINPLGLGLLQPFKYPPDEILTPVDDDDLQEILLSPQSPKGERRNSKRPASLTNTYPESTESPPSKKRRLSTEINQP